MCIVGAHKAIDTCKPKNMSGQTWGNNLVITNPLGQHLVVLIMKRHVIDVMDITFIITTPKEFLAFKSHEA